MVSTSPTTQDVHNVASIEAEGPGVFDQIVVNDDLQRAYQSLRTTVTQVRGAQLLYSRASFSLSFAGDGAAV